VDRGRGGQPGSDFAVKNQAILAQTAIVRRNSRSSLTGTREYDLLPLNEKGGINTFL
jgi:hypothetical protein